MKKSLLSKLLAGVMSLGMVTGGSAIQNVCAMEDDYEEDYDDDAYAVEEAKPIQQKTGKSGITRSQRASCLCLDFVPYLGRGAAHSLCGIYGEALVAFATTLIARGAYNYGEDLVMTKENIETLTKIIQKCTEAQSTNVKTKTDEIGNLVNADTGAVILSKDEVETFKSIDRKRKWAKWGLPLAVFFAWPIYDGIQLIRGE